jgi:uncharacterized alkaline shock family protein YloU
MTEPPSGPAPVESVHSASASAHISHAVIATYAAAAAVDVDGVAGIAGGPLGAIDPERAPKGVRVSGDGVRVDLELHLITAWGAHIPTVARDVARQVRAYLASMIDLRPGEVAVVVDDVAPPA